MNQHLSGNDSLYGYAGNDTLDGGEGNDYLDGGVGNDTYVFARGYGQDTIYDYDTTSGNVDTVHLGAGIAPTDVTVTRDYYNLYLSINGTADKLTLSSWFSSDAYRVEQVHFAGGAVWNADLLRSKAKTGTAGNDTLISGVDADSLSGLGGNDTLYGYDGNDTLDGGEGNDYLDGGVGNDTYVFARGYGQDTISEADWTSGNVDTVRLGAGIAPSDITVTRDNSNLYLSINGTTDKLALNNWAYGDAYRVEQVQFADGAVWNGAALNDAAVYVRTGGSTGDYLSGDFGRDSLSGLGGNDTLYGYAGNDTLDGGEGNDFLTGGPGADRFVFNTTPSTTNQDTITDFSVTDNDTMALASSVFAKLAGKTNLANHFRLSTQAAVGGDDYIVYNPANGQLSYDDTGSGANSGLVFATLANKPQNITASQFVVL